MCIRDSLSPASARAAEKIGYTNVKIFLDGMPEWNKRNYSCLLYTSDAADERSSVDLGGRRIIKKKNHTRTP